MFIYDASVVAEAFSVNELAERNKAFAAVADLNAERRVQLDDSAKITSLGRARGTHPEGNAKVIASLPLPVAQWILREAPHILVDDKCWKLFIDANPAYKL